MSSNLRNKNYYILNTQYTRDGYFEKLKEFRLDTIEGTRVLKDQFFKLVQQALHKYALITKSVNSTGNNLENVKNAKQCFDMFNLEDVRYCIRGYNVKDSVDIFGVDDTEWAYESVNEGLFSSHDKFCIHSHTHCMDLQYCDYCRTSSYLFGCVSVRDKQYCILNCQYDKATFEDLRAHIIGQMHAMPYVDRFGRKYAYGEFFPAELSPFAYNESVAQEYFLLSKEEVEREGFDWKETEKRHYQITREFLQLPDGKGGIPDTILDDIISCEHKGACAEQCTEAFRIIPEELRFYRRLLLPPPTLCPNCRHYGRRKSCPPTKLWQRQCMCEGGTSGHTDWKNTARHSHGNNHCLNQFETSYAPDRPEIVYCEQCYQAEVA
jgi:hypothetical protein